MTDNTNKIIELEALLLERDNILKEKEAILDELQNKLVDQDEIHNHLVTELTELKQKSETSLSLKQNSDTSLSLKQNSDTSLLLKERDIVGDQLIDMERDIETKENNFNNILERELNKQKILEEELKNVNCKFNNKNTNCLELGQKLDNLSNTVVTLNKDKESLIKELDEHIFKNTLINIVLNKELLKLNSKYNGYGILLKLTLDNQYQIDWVNPKYKKFVNIKRIFEKIGIKDTSLVLTSSDINKENTIILPFNAELKIDFKDIDNGFTSIAELQKKRRNLKILERLRDYSLFKKETHDKSNKRYSQKNLYFIIPSIFITALSGIFSFLSTTSSMNSNMSITFSILVGILASISTFMQSFSGAMDFGGKAEAHSVATEEYDLILTAIKFEITNPYDSINNPIDFYEKIKNKIMEIKQKCKYQVPHDIIVSYSSQTVNFELGRIRDELIREAANMKAEMMKNEIESKGEYHDIELGNIKKEFDFRIVIDNT